MANSIPIVEKRHPLYISDKELGFIMYGIGSAAALLKAKAAHGDQAAYDWRDVLAFGRRLEAKDERHFGRERQCAEFVADCPACGTETTFKGWKDGPAAGEIEGGEVKLEPPG